MAMTDDQAPLELGPGERPSGYKVGQPDSSGTTVSISEAARRLGVSVSTVRRRLKAGEIDGAYKAPGPDGEEYRIPVSSLPDPSTAPPVTSLEDDLRRQLDEERRARELAEALLESERRGRDELARTVEVLRESIAALNRALPAAPSISDVLLTNPQEVGHGTGDTAIERLLDQGSRKWFRRNKAPKVTS